MDNPSVYRDGKVRTMRDTIYRDDAIEVIDKRIYALMKDPEYRRKNSHIDLYGAKELLRDLPSADRPQGEWIKKPHKVYLPRDYEPDIIDYRDRQYNEEDHSIIEYWWHCNQCDYEADRWFKPTFNFCPNCGARMKGVDDE